MESSVAYAEEHFSQLLRVVAAGEEVLLRDGEIAVARIVPIKLPQAAARPRVGEITSAPVHWSPDSFAALDDEGMKELGLL